MTEERCPLCDAPTHWWGDEVVVRHDDDCPQPLFRGWPLVRGLVEACQAVNDGEYGCEEKVFQALAALPKNRNPDACPECSSDEDPEAQGEVCSSCKAQRQADAPREETDR